jgi:hypothetical protein
MNIQYIVRKLDDDDDEDDDCRADTPGPSSAYSSNSDSAVFLPGFLLPVALPGPSTQIRVKPKSSELSDDILDRLQLFENLTLVDGKREKPCKYKSDMDDHTQVANITIRVRPFSDVHSSIHLVHALEQSCETLGISYYGPNRNIYLTASDDYTHAILFGYPMPVFPDHILPEHVIGMAQMSMYETPPPPAFIPYAQKYIGTYFVGEHPLGSMTCSKNNLPCSIKDKVPKLLNRYLPFVRHVCHPILTLPLVPSKKTRLMSIHISGSVYMKATYGAKYCRWLVQRILRSDLPIDIYGTGTIGDNIRCVDESANNPTDRFSSRGGRINSHDVRIRGPVANMDDMLNPYMYHICIESCVSHAYYSGRAVNSLLRKTNLIYFGSRELVNRFPSGIIVLTGDLDEDMELLRQVTIDPLRYYVPIDGNQIEKIKRAENLVKWLPHYYAENKPI